MSLIGTLQEIVRAELAGLRIAELGVVDAVQPHEEGGDSDNYACDVKLKNSGLLLRRVPIATDRIGSVAPPNVGDLVLLAFDKGDVNQPIVIGRLYDERQRAPVSHLNEVIFRLPLDEDDDKTIKAAIRKTDSDPKRELLFEMPPKIKVQVTDDHVSATAGQTEMKLDQPGGGSDGKVTVTAGRTTITMDQDGTVTIESATNLSIEAETDLKIKGASVSIEATGGVTVSGATATLKASGSATVQGNGGATLKGAMVTIQGNTSFSP
ncbi:MAG TPA: phage baseplate assembly protein V [Thermoanaerobaculia bacterium]|nr:phage baseplate assembly protein V [Thermoanaerobaculia bacterium]